MFIRCICDYTPIQRVSFQTKPVEIVLVATGAPVLELKDEERTYGDAQDEKSYLHQNAIEP